MSFTLDLTDDHTRLMYTLLIRIRDLSIEVATGMSHSRGSVLAMCWADGFTAKRTKKGALIDLLTMQVALNDDEFVLADIHTKHLHSDEKKRQAIIRKIYRDGKKWRENGRPGAIG